MMRAAVYRTGCVGPKRKHTLPAFSGKVESPDSTFLASSGLETILRTAASSSAPVLDRRRPVRGVCSGATACSTLCHWMLAPSSGSAGGGSLVKLLSRMARNRFITMNMPVTIRVK